MKLIPRCLSQTNEKPVAFTATGFIVPCCWCDNKSLFKNFKEITQEKFHISNIKSPEEVFDSDEWKKLMNTIKNDGANAPEICRRKCGSDWIAKEVIIKC